MTLSALHAPVTSYLDERNSLLKHWENDPLYQHSLSSSVTQQDLRAHQDSRGFIAIGYGLDLLHNNVQEIAGYFIAANIQLHGPGSVGLSQADLDLITAYQRKKKRDRLLIRSVAGSSTRAKRRIQTGGRCKLGLPLRRSKGRLAIQTGAERGQFMSKERFVNPPQPLVRERDGGRIGQGRMPEARPRPLHCRLHQLRTDGIA